MPEPTENYSKYLECVRETIKQQPSEWTFKRDERYRLVLEHSTAREAQLSYECAEQAMPGIDLREDIRAFAEENDKLGEPGLGYIENYGFSCSPGNGRYFWHAIALLRHIESTLLNRVTIVEIGAGYGGLAFYVRRLAKYFPTIMIAAYIMIDVDAAVTLQNMYMHATNTEAVSINGLDEMRIKLLSSYKHKVVFSAYAFSEFDAEMKAWYEHNLLKSCDHGFMVWNLTEGFYDPKISSKVLGGGVYNFVPQFIHIEPEQPLIRPGQLFVKW
jgi:hypothetical protein